MELVDRMILHNQFIILEKLNPREADFYKKAQEILELGLVAEYRDIEMLFAPEMTKEQCVEVGDILQMFDLLKLAYEGLQENTGIDQHHLTFLGFDGNNEGVQMRYAEFLRRNGSFTTILTGSLNSHHPVLDRYRNMVGWWKASADRFTLTREDILRITARE
jgi:uncharacterized protein YfbU (UPF0304 family)